MEHRKDVLLELAEANRPAPVRNLYYRAVVAGIVPKTDSGYSKVQRALVDLRREGALPYEWLTDNIRWRRKPRTWNGLDELLENTASTYRRALWAGTEETVEVWCESDSIAGVIGSVTASWDVPLLPVRGFSSLTFAYSSARALNQQERPAVIYYVGDLDPAGLDIERSLRRYLDEWATVSVKFERLAITWEQVEEFDLPGTSPKKKYGYDLAVEAEAMAPPELRDLVEQAVVQHLDQHQVNVLQIVEENERESLYRMAGELAR